MEDITFKWFLWEMLMTFSGQKGFFASKRIESFITFSLATLSIFVYVILRFTGVLTIATMPATDIVWLSGTLYSYGGYNRIMMARESKAPENLDQPKKEDGADS